MSTYDQHLAEQEKKAQARQAQYEAARREQADRLAASTQAIYDDAKKAASQTAAQAVKDTDASYRELYDANAVSELVARRETEEAISNLGLRRSGLNTTQQTAISLSRSRADGRTSAQKQEAIDTIMRELDSLHAKYDSLAAEKTAAIYSEADSDVQDNLATLMRQAHSNAKDLADADYEAQLAREALAAEQAKAALQAQNAANKATGTTKSESGSGTNTDSDADGDTDADAVSLFSGDTKNLTKEQKEQLKAWQEESRNKQYVHETAPSLTAIKVNTMIKRKNESDVAAYNFLVQRLNRGYISLQEMRQIMLDIGLKTPAFPSESEVIESARRLRRSGGMAKAVDYLDSLYADQLIGVRTLYAAYDDIGYTP